MVDALQDSYGRRIRDLRISLTDRCNFRCFYCRPNGEPPIANKKTILTFEEIFEVSELFVSLGIDKIRLTGGEPLLRKDIEKLVSKLSKLKPKLKDIAITTNGFNLSSKAESLKQAGLDRVTISLDSLRSDRFLQITGVDQLKAVLAAIESAKEARLTPIKINVVVIKNQNDDEIVDFAKFARDQDVSVRFIEFMPLDSEHNWQRKLMVAGKDIFERINKKFPLQPKEKFSASETAKKFAFADGAKGEIGIIASVTESFCNACSRVRLTSDGQIRTCLFSREEHNLREIIRGKPNRNEKIEYIRNVIFQKEKGHRINDEDFVQPERSMSLIGG